MKRTKKIDGAEYSSSDINEIFSVVSQIEIEPATDFKIIEEHLADDEYPENIDKENIFATWNMPPQDVSQRRYPSGGLLF